MSKSILFLIVAAVVVVVVGGGWYYYSQSSGAKTDTVQTGELSEEDQQKLLDKVGKLILLPADEKPSVAVVDNAELLSTSQPFFKDVVNGDQVLIYSAKAIIYRPSTHLIINVGPVQRNENANAPEGSTPPPVTGTSEEPATPTPSKTTETPATPPSSATPSSN